MHDSLLLLKAADFAARKHCRQRRKNGDTPYINHPLGVARILAEEGGVVAAPILAAALLHDTLEDTDTTFAELEFEFGRQVADIVAAVTDDRQLPKAERKRRQVEHAPSLSESARLVKLADKLHNLRDLATQPPPSWDMARVQGYFCWAAAVVAAIGAINEPLRRALDTVFGSQLTVDGRSCRAMPIDLQERDRLLAAYYDRLANTDD